MADDAIKVLLIEDSTKDVLTIRMMLADAKERAFEIDHAASLASGLARLEATSHQIVLLDVSLKDGGGLAALEKVQAKAPATPVVILTGREDRAIAYDAVRKGAQDYIVKTKMDSNLLSRTIHYAVERHRVMEDMRRQNDELKRLSALKSEFVSTVSHELRTPLTVILSATNNLIDGAFGDMSDAQKKWMKKISHHSLRLHDMISDILDLSKLQSGKAEMRRESVELSRLLKTTVANLQTLTRDKNISLTHHVPDLPAIWAEAGRLEQVLTNLITNAIKFTPPDGHVEVSAALSGGEVTVTVSDTGPGIAPEYREVIFDRFRQIRSLEKPESSTQGIGLGLAICREIVTQHHGTIWVESELGHGSQFHFRIPVDARAGERPTLNILVVDDDEEIGELMTATLAQEGYNVSVSKNGKHALQLILDKHNHFDLVFLDLMLPGANGAEIIKALRRSRVDIEIAVVTAYPNSDMLFQGMSHGPLTIIAKPFAPETILDVARKIKAGLAGKAGAERGEPKRKAA